MIYVVDYEFSDDHGGGMFGPYVFDNYDKALEFFIEAVKDRADEIKWKKSRSCYAADLYRVDYHTGKSNVIMKYNII